MASAMPLAELDSHQNNCGAAYVTCGMQCGSRECTHRCRRGALQKHKALCHFRLVPCPQGCGTSYQATEVGPHAVVCASRRVRCPFASCGMVLHAAAVPAHNAAFAQEHLRGLQAALEQSNALVTRLTPTAGLPTRVLKLLQDVATRKLAADAAAASLADLASCASNGEMGAAIWVERGDSVAVHALSSYPEDAACAVHVAALDLLHEVVTAARAACAAAQKSGEGGAAVATTGLRAAAIQNVGELYTAAADAAVAHILGSPGKRGACSHGPSVAAAVQVVAAVAEAMGGGAPVAMTDKLRAAACKAVQAAPDSAVAASAACRALAALLGLVAREFLAMPPGLAQAESAATAARAAMRKHGVETPGVMLYAWRVLQLSGVACTDANAPDDVACALAVLRAHRGDTAVGAAAMQVLRLACDAKGGPLPFLVAKGPQTVSDVIGASVVLDDKELVAAAASIVKRTCDPVAGGGDAAAAQWLDCGTPHWVTAALAPFAPRGTVVDVATSLAAVEAAMALLNQAQSPASVPAHDGREVSTLRQEAAHAFLGAGFAPALCKAIHTAAREHHAQLACVACMVVRKLGFGHASGAHAMAKSSVPEAVIKLLHSLDATVGGHVFPAWRGATYATAPEGEPVTAAAVGTCVLETAVLALSTFLDTAASAADGGGVANAFGVGAPPLNWAASAAIHVAELGALGVARSVADKLGTTKGHDTVDALAYALGVPESDMA